MAVKVGSFTKSTGGAPASQAVTGIGFQPKALILWTAAQTSADGFGAGFQYAIGFTAGASSSGSISGASQDNQDTSNSSRAMAAKALTIVTWGESVIAECDLSSFDADGFTLNWTTNDANAYIIHYMALGGDDLTDAKVLSWALATGTGNQAVTGVGFQPDAVLHLCANSSSSLPLAVASASLSVGAMDSGGQWAGYSWSRDNQGTSDTQGVLFANKTLYGANTSGMADHYETFVSLDADGFTINVVDAPPSAYKVFSLCLKGGSYEVKGLDTTGTLSPPKDETFTGFGFTPEGIWCFTSSSNVNGNNSYILTDGHISLGATDGVAEGAALAVDDTGQGTSNNAGYSSSSDDFLLYDRDSNQNLTGRADIKSLNADGFTITKNPWPNTIGIGYFGFAGGTAETGETLDLVASGASTSAGSLRMTVFGAIFAGASASAGSLRMRIGRHFAASGASSSAGSLRMPVLSAGMVLVTQAGLIVDVDSTPPVNVTQAGVLLDAIRTPPVNVTQAGALLDAIRTPPVKVTQAGLIIDVDSTSPIRVTQAGLMIDARYQRPENLLNCWEFWVEDIIGHHLAYLDGATGKAYLEALSDCGGGTFTISSHDPKATAANLAVGNIVKVRYRNVDIGAWMIENIQEALVGAGEEAEQAYVVSGRGLLALLEHGLVYPADLADAGTAEREFDGVSKASILLDLYAEFMLRGGGELNMAFGPDFDSAAIAFTDTVVLNFKAGQNLLDVARNLSGLGLELTADPDKTLQAWNTAGVDRSATICFRQGQSVMSSRRTTEGIGLTNAVLGEGQGVYVESVDATSIGSHRRRESYLPVRNTDDAGQVGVANALLLAGWKEPRSAYTLEVLAEPFYPFFDYAVGDVVAISIPDELEGDYRILGISIKEISGPCDLRVTLEINDLATEYLHKLQLAFDASLMSVRPGPASASGLASSGTEPVVEASGTALGPGAIKAAQVDWGTGTEQVSAADVPIADVGTYYATNDVEAALQQIGNSLAGLSGASHAAVTLGTDADTLLGLTGQQITLDTQAANKVLAGPTTGAAADPAFRALVSDDIPTLDHGAKLTGLGDDDHTQYLLATGARDGATSSAQQFVVGSRHGDDTDHADFASNGQLTLAGDARVVRDVQIPLTGLGKGAAAPATVYIGNYIGFEFTTGDTVYYSTEIPYDWDASTNLIIELHWYIDEARGTPAKEVAWELLYTATKENASEAVDSGSTTVPSGDILIPVTAKFLTQTYLAIPYAALALDDVIGVQIKRVAIADGTAPTAKPVLVGAMIEYTVDKLGEAV